MSMFFYGSAAVKFAYLAEVFLPAFAHWLWPAADRWPSRWGRMRRALPVSRAIEIWGWQVGYVLLVGAPLGLQGFAFDPGCAAFRAWGKKSLIALATRGRGSGLWLADIG